MGLEHSEYKTKVVCGSNPSLELIKNPAFSFNTTKATTKPTTKKQPHFKSVELDILNMLREKWEDVEIETFEDITKEAKRLSKSEQQRLNISEHRGELNILRYDKISYFDYKYPFYLAIEDNIIYLLIIRTVSGKAISIKKLFNIKSDSSISDFYEEALPTKDEYKMCKIVNVLITAWASKINELDTLEKFYNLPLPITNSKNAGVNCINLKVEEEYISVFWLNGIIQIEMLGGRYQVFQHAQTFKTFTEHYRKKLMIMDAKIKEYGGLI
jgi:hypothetical protein